MKVFFNYFLKIFKAILLFIIIFLILDIILFAITPDSVKTKIYNKRAHKIQSYYFHHDLRPNVSFYDNWGDKKYLIHSNSLGFKSNKKGQIKYGQKNILFIGDSLVEGVGVRYNDTFVGKLQKDYQSEDVSFLNASLQSYSNSIYLTKIYHLLERKKIKINEVVLMFTANDVHDDYYRYGKVNEEFILKHEDNQNRLLIYIINFIKGNTFTYQIAAEFSPPRAGIQKIKNILNKINQKKGENTSKVELNENQKKNHQEVSIDTVNRLTSRKDYEFLYNRNKFNLWGNEALNNTLVTFDRLIDYLNKKNIKLTVLYPTEAFYLLKKPDPKLYDFFKTKFSNFFSEKKIKFIVLEDYHSNYSSKKRAYEELFFIGDVHWNIKGHRAVYEELKIKLNF